MQHHVIRSIHQQQIANFIVGFVAIDVMHMKTVGYLVPKPFKRSPWVRFQPCEMVGPWEGLVVCQYATSF